MRILWPWLTPIAAVVTIWVAHGSVAFAFDVRAYYPLGVGTARTYEAERRSETVVGTKRTGEVETGRVREEVIGVSKLSGVGKLVYKVYEYTEFRGVGVFPLVQSASVSHLSATKNAILLHGVDDEVWEFPMVLFSDPPIPMFGSSPLEGTSTSETTRMQMGVISQTTETVTVPAGRFRKAVKQVFEATLAGELDGQTIREGTIRETAWYAKRVGMVQRRTKSYFRIQMSEGIDKMVTETVTWRLTNFTTD